MQSNECLLEEGWYLLKSKSRQELRACENLENQGFDVYCPHVKVKHRGVIKEESLFPGYLFLYLDLRDLERYHKIRSTRGVSEIVYFNRITRKLHQDGRLGKAQEAEAQELLPKPIPNGDEVMKDVRAIVQMINDEAEGISKPAEGFQEGDKVSMDHPLYKGLEMTFMANLGNQRGIILIEYIKKQRSEKGETVAEVVSRKEVKVSLKDLEKA